MDLIIDQGIPLSNLLSIIIQNYLLNFYSICLIWDTNKSDIEVNIFLKYISSDSQLPLSNFQLIKFTDSLDSERQLVTAISMGCQVFLVSIFTAMEFMTLYLNAIHKNQQRFARNHFLFVPFNNYNESFHEILDHQVLLEVPNILIIDKLDEQIFDLYTTRFTGLTNQTEPIWLDTFYGSNKTFEKNTNLLMDKLQNLEKRSIKVATVNYEPYSIIEEVSPGTGNVNKAGSTEEKTLQLDGTESRMILEFCLKINCIINLLPIADDDWGNVYENGSGYGLFGTIAMKDVDVGFGAVYAWLEPYRYVDVSPPMSRSSVVLLAPKPKRLPEYLVLIMPFTLWLWIAVLVSLAISAGSLIIVDFFRFDSKYLQSMKPDVNLSDIFIEVTAVFLGQSSERIVQKIPEMVILGSILLITMTIGNAYSGGLASFMSVPQYEPPIETVHQLATISMAWGAVSDAWLFSILLSTEPDLVKLRSTFQVLNRKQMEERTRSRDYCFCIERLLYGHFAVEDFIKLDDLDFLRAMRDDVYYGYTIAMSYKTWYMNEAFHLFIMRVFESGIQRYWELQASLKHLDNKVQLGIATSRETHHDAEGPISLQVSHLLGAFFLLFIGMLLSFVCFMIELMLYRRNNRKSRKLN